MRYRIAAAVLAALAMLATTTGFAQQTPPRSSATAHPAVHPQAQAADSAAALAAEAQAALDRNDFQAAIPLLQQLIAARPMEALPHFELGLAYSELKRYDEAATEYRKAIEIDPTLAPAHVNLGLVLLDSDPAAALAEFRRAAELQPDQARPHYLAGEALEKAGKSDDAIAEYQAAVKLAPNDESMRFVLGRALLNAAHAADAEAQFRAAIALQANAGAPQGAAQSDPSAPRNAAGGVPAATGAEAAAATQAKLGLAEALLRENKSAEAADAFAAYLADAPDDRAARVERAAALQNAGRLDEALAELDKADMSVSPGSDSLKLRGNIYLQQMKWMDAAAALERAAALAPADAEMHSWLGRARMELHDYTAARNELERAFKLDNTSLEPVHELVAVYYLSGDYPSAIEETDLLATRQALAAGDWFFRALSCDKLGRKSDAAAAYRKFLDLDAGQHADQDWQAQQRLKTLQREMK